jgi:crotonobetainyl-CoA:carnitine CoA-transferase CaiB-like acyl-CoA transferase
MADKVAGLTALYATTMALFHQERSGEGQEVEVAMIETMASFMLVEHANGAMFDPALGPRSTRGQLRPIAGRCRSRLGLEPILLLHAELPRGSIFRLPPRRVCR